MPTPPSSTYWTAARLERVKDLYAAHAQLTTAWAQAAAPAPREAAAAAAQLEEAGAALDEAIGVIDEARKKQRPPPACKSPRRRHSPPWTANGTAWPPTAITR